MLPSNPSPANADEILNPVWLNQQIYAAYPGVTVTGCELVERLGPTATKLRIKVTLNGAGEGVPRTICIKAMLDEFAATPGSGTVSALETRFYRELAPMLANVGVVTPPCHFTGIDDESGHGLFAMEDLIVAGAQFLSALNPYSPDEARMSLDQLARLHAASWGLPDGYRQTWIGHRLQRMAANPMLPHDVLQQLLDGPRSDGLPAGVANAERLYAALGKMAERFRDEPICLIHGDAHAGNLYQHSGQIGLIDWQLLQNGHWAQDVAYHIAAALRPDVRRASERDLLAHYLGRLHAHGGPCLNLDVAWNDYRAATAYGYYLWGVTRRVDPDIIIEFNRRLGLAVAELACFDVLGV